MYYNRDISAIFFDMDGIIIDSEPLWNQAQNEVLSKLDIKIPNTSKTPDSIGLRIDQSVLIWYKLLPKDSNRPSQKEIIDDIITRAMLLIEERKPLLPGVESALILCKTCNLKIGLASASPLFMLKRVLNTFGLSHYFDLVISAECLPYSKPHPQIYIDAAAQLNIIPQQCIAIEDSINGMIATKAALMNSIVIPAIEYQNDPRWCLANKKLRNLTQLTISHLGI
ncbi:2-deoxyglucose-6-phosphatase [Candidatus Pantoea edessiphila]|uniref:2-deoxyglucose-6-phosphatase n=1 Tax=Candidatus Pantoea edessiphila TaxID=2044610 RepID=A0A2P5SYW8_9GAMM|nr:hexitol phosphatase HxpB [Candidatus Pantoea edessiphila]MBK4775376.1 hexitol phosphatase HxpB [Pantoea sp. Edef]PPI87493.1 2-deoxyglucose-6-phosphatase [Candidatus Pantoea edessiphila]